jgi:hypothetical protein
LENVHEMWTEEQRKGKGKVSACIIEKNSL